MHPAPSDDSQYTDRISALLVTHAKIADELAGLPVNSVRAGHLRCNLLELNGVIELIHSHEHEA